MSSDTPRTNAKAYGGDWEQVVSADFARILEHELAEARAEVERLRQDNDAYKTTFNLNPSAAYTQIQQLRTALRIACETLENIHVAAHCIVKAGPLHTPTLQDAWGKFMDLEVMAVKGLSAIRETNS